MMPEQLMDDVWQVYSPIPEGQLDYTLTYVLVGSHGQIHLVDPGWGDETNFRALARSLNAIGFAVEDLATVIATHHHPDHLGIAARLRELSGARIVMSLPETEVLRRQLAPESRDRPTYEHRLDSWRVPDDRREELRTQFDRPALLGPVAPDQTVLDGDRLRLDGHDLDVILTPGHTGGHMCLVDASRGLIYTGDHVLPHVFSGVGIGVLPGTQPLGDYLSSLRKLQPFEEMTVLPGHGHVFTGLGARSKPIIWGEISKWNACPPTSVRRRCGSTHVP